ncbi:recombinase family protein [Rhodococcus sp. NPDC056960]|uniref:recombinase family protein n=1 Tax=Rhodococcus sp. NPDC056960 TaxID=3345982 RepID=UPI003635B390
MRVGYGRVSTRDQHPEAQHDALTAAGCEEVFVEKASGKLASRPELDRALLSANRAGDQLVVTKLDRHGRLLEHLIDLSKQLDAHRKRLREQINERITVVDCLPDICNPVHQPPEPPPAQSPRPRLRTYSED